MVYVNKKKFEQNIYRTRTQSKVVMIMHFFRKLILQRETKPKPLFFTLVYNECAKA